MINCHFVSCKMSLHRVSRETAWCLCAMWLTGFKAPACQRLAESQVHRCGYRRRHRKQSHRLHDHIWRIIRFLPWRRHRLPDSPRAGWLCFVDQRTPFIMASILKAEVDVTAFRATAPAHPDIVLINRSSSATAHCFPGNLSRNKLQPPVRLAHICNTRYPETPRRSTQSRNQKQN
jgi:hypothetical protein